MATEFVGIELELRGEEGVYSDLRKIQSIMNSLGGRKKIDAGLQDARRQVVAYRGELEKLQREQVQLKNTAKQAGDALATQTKSMNDAFKRWGKAYENSAVGRYHKEMTKQAQVAYDEATKAVQAQQDAIDSTKNALKDSQQAYRVFQQGIKESGKTFNQTASAIASRMKQTGSAMQTLGNTMQRLTSPFTRLASGFVMGAGYKALNTLTEGLSRGFERYDTMKKYPKIMDAFGYSAEEAQKSIGALDQSVRGLPTGLDEMVDMSQRFTATTGNIEKGTKLAIAANNAFLASMSTDTQRYQGMMQLQDVLGGKDMNAREWNSLVSSMTPAIVKMGEALGYSKNNMSEWIQEVRDGNVANEEFIDLLIKVGTEGGEVAKMAENSKDTWQAFFANVGNAASRMTAGVLKAFDELTQQLFGVDLNKFMSENVITAIDNMAKSVQSWIKANPDKIIDFFNTLKSIDFVGFGRGLLEGYGMMAKAFQGLSETFGGSSLKWFGKALVMANIYGKAFSVIGGLIKGLSPLIGKLGALLLHVGKLGIFGRIAELFGGLGGAKGATEAVETVGTLGKASAGMVTLAKNIGLAAVSIAAIGGAGFVAFRSFKTIVKDLHEAIAEINSFSTGELQQADVILFSMVAALTGFVTAADAIGLAVGSLGAIGTAPAVIGSAVMAIVGAMAALVSAETMAIFKSFEQATKSIKQGLKNLEGLDDIKINTGKINTALGTMKQIMETFDASYDEGGSAKEGGKAHSDWSANSAKFAVVSENIAKSVKGIKDTMAELDTLPDITDAEVRTATDKITNIVEKMRDIAGAFNLKFDLGALDWLTGSTIATPGKTAKAGTIIQNIGQAIRNIKDTVADLKEFEKINLDLDTATQNVKDIGSKMGEIFTALNEAFGQEFETNVDGVSVIKTNEGVTDAQKTAAENMKSLFESYRNTTSAIRGVYEDLVGGKDKEAFNPKKFGNMMKNLVGEDGKGGILSEMKGLYDNIISETDGFGAGAELDLAGTAEGFAQAMTSVKNAISTLQEIEGIEFGEGGMGSIASSIKTMVKDLVEAFSAESILTLTARVDAFKQQIETIKTTLQSLGEGGIEVNIEIIPNITGDDTTVKELEDAHDAIETARDAIKKLSESINLSFPISVSLPGLESAINEMYSAASRLRAARAALNSARGGTYVSTGGYIGASGKVLYRAGGGNVPFGMKPRGTDVVPAMLSYGEYVQRRRAVDFWGIDFMRKVNNLDIRGVMSDLMAKAGSMANVGRQTVINNTYNNNQKVVQNINTNNPDFAYRSASRFVGAF